MFLVLSDIQLDQPLVMDKLAEVFQGFEATYMSMTGLSQDDEAPESYVNDFSDVTNAPNLVFILMGSFITKPIAVPGGRQAAQSTFSSLADTIASCPHIAHNAKFVLVPGWLCMKWYFSICIIIQCINVGFEFLCDSTGPDDPGNAGIMPRFPFPKLFVQGRLLFSFLMSPLTLLFFDRADEKSEAHFLCDKSMPNAILHARNCHMQRWPSEKNATPFGITSRSVWRQPSTSGATCEVYLRSRTLISASGSFKADSLGTGSCHATLSPTTIGTCSSYILIYIKLCFYHLSNWINFWYCFSGDVPQLILGDKTEQFSLTYSGCLAVNPGSFSSDFSFVVYRPSTKEIEFSKVPS
jgi:hypothetical protein